MIHEVLAAAIQDIEECQAKMPETYNVVRPEISELLEAMARLKRLLEPP